MIYLCHTSSMRQKTLYHLQTMKTLPPPPPICADVYIDHVSPKIMLMHRTTKKLKNYAVVWLLTTANQTMTRSTKLELCFIVFNI
jgi:hypothetical protein